MGSVVLIRHASTDASQAGRNLGQGSDPPLSSSGAMLAARLGRSLAAELATLTVRELRVISSPALRCRQTSAAVAGELDAIAGRIADSEIEPGLLELDYGEWEGLTPQECAARDPELRAAWEADPFATAAPGGESGAAVVARSAPVFEAAEAWAGRDRGNCAVIVAHNHVNRLRLVALLGRPLSEYRRRVTQDPAGYSIIGLGGDLPAVRRINAIPCPP